MKKYLLLAAMALTILAACTKNPAPPPPSVLGFFPQQGAASIPVYIFGLHFDTVIAHITVKFNGITAKIQFPGFDTLAVYVPVGATTGKITVTVNGATATSATDFTILPGSWVQKADLRFPNSPIGREGAVGFAIGNYGYVGLGGDNGGIFSDLNQYDPVANTWTQKASLPITMQYGVCMVLNNKAYVGVGQTADSIENTSRFFEYDPTTDKWTGKANFPGAARAYPFGWAIGGKGYVGLGLSQGNNPYDVWQYDPATDSWTQKADFPHTGSYPIWGTAFTLGDTVAYIVGSGQGYPEPNYCWRYKPSTDTWQQMSNIPTAPGRYLEFPATMVINGQGYVVGGGFTNWRYDPVSDSWKSLAFFASRAGGVAYVVNGTGYYGTGFGWPGILHTDLWQYQP